MCALRCLLIQVTDPIFLADSRIATVGQGTSRSNAEARHVVLILAEGAFLRHLCFVATEAVIYYVPHHAIRLHGGRSKVCEVIDEVLTIDEVSSRRVQCSVV